MAAICTKDDPSLPSPGVTLEPISSRTDANNPDSGCLSFFVAENTHAFFKRTGKMLERTSLGGSTRLCRLIMITCAPSVEGKNQDLAVASASYQKNSVLAMTLLTPHPRYEFEN